MFNDLEPGKNLINRILGKLSPMNLKFANGAMSAASMDHLFNGEGLTFIEKLKATLDGVKNTLEHWREVGTAWHFEGREAANGIHPTYDEVIMSEGGWRKLSRAESTYHDNGEGAPELKFIHDRSGREAVFTMDQVAGGSTNGNYQPYTDPKYVATFNYVTTSARPVNLTNDILGAAKWAATGIGHVVTDVIPYKAGLGNVRGPN